MVLSLHCLPTSPSQWLSPTGAVDRHARCLPSFATRPPASNSQKLLGCWSPSPFAESRAPPQTLFSSFAFLLLFVTALQVSDMKVLFPLKFFSFWPSRTLFSPLVPSPRLAWHFLRPPLVIRGARSPPRDPSLGLLATTHSRPTPTQPRASRWIRQSRASGWSVGGA